MPPAAPDRRADRDEHRVDRRPFDGSAGAGHVRVAQDLVDRGRGLEIALDRAVEERGIGAARRGDGQAQAGPDAAPHRFGTGRDHHAVCRRLAADHDGPRGQARIELPFDGDEEAVQVDVDDLGHVGSPVPAR